jgi:hypothetical protein
VKGEKVRKREDRVREGKRVRSNCQRERSDKEINVWQR